ITEISSPTGREIEMADIEIAFNDDGSATILDHTTSGEYKGNTASWTLTPETTDTLCPKCGWPMPLRQTLIQDTTSTSATSQLVVYEALLCTNCGECYSKRNRD